jgi:hypothetical protein
MVKPWTQDPPNQPLSTSLISTFLLNDFPQGAAMRQACARSKFGRVKDGSLDDDL